MEASKRFVGRDVLVLSLLGAAACGFLSCTEQRGLRMEPPDGQMGGEGGTSSSAGTSGNGDTGGGNGEQITTDAGAQANDGSSNALIDAGPGAGGCKVAACPMRVNAEAKCLSDQCSYVCSEGFVQCPDETCRLECPKVEWIDGFGMYPDVQATNKTGSAFVVYNGEGSGKWVKGRGVVAPFKIEPPNGVAHIFFAITDDGRYAFGHQAQFVSDGRNSITVWDDLEPNLISVANDNQTEGLAATPDGDFVFGNTKNGLKRWSRQGLQVVPIEPGQAYSLALSPEGLAFYSVARGIVRWSPSGSAVIGPVQHYVISVAEGAKSILVGIVGAVGLLVDGVFNELPLGPDGAVWESRGMSADGGTIIGLYKSSGDARRTMIWKQGFTRAQDLQKYLEDKGLAPGNLESNSVVISRDGTVVIGSGPRGVFRIVLP